MRADPREDPVGEPDDSLLRGHEAAALSQQDDQRRLAQVGRLAGHVRPGEDDDLRRFRVELQVVGDEHARGQRLLDQRMAARLDEEPGPGVDLRAPPAQPGGGGRKARESIDRADGPRRRAELRARRRDALTELAQDLELASIHLLPRAEHDGFLFPELLGHVALCGRQRLLARVVVRDGGRVGVTDLDVVPEHLVEADLQRADAGARALVRFQRRDPLARGSRCIADRVELCVEPGLDGPAVPRCGRFLQEGAAQNFGQLRRRRDLARMLAQHQRFAAGDRTLHAGQRLERTPQRDQLAYAGPAVGGARAQALQVAHAVHRVMDGFAQRSDGCQLGDRGEAELDRLGVAQRRSHPFPQSSCADRGR